ncbi:hypothetical protein [Saccharicrinis fermentans]|uniref:Uncharacterized protein n=1 Tax=Saccharicrinis fermentans DSM 9555 = JCM 21142 TaxID=869213 RepID=W7YLM7_9BACT|nr:hypothetical protein [Saccharicrinis fermentans]GAF03264.1 hypothetical protein JCM21142_41931 [Saccharicrinis fermentans DSM 9555 = JCM 21142]
MEQRLTIRNSAHELVAVLPFRLLSMMPIAERFFRTCWLDSSVLVNASLLEDEQHQLEM